MEESGRPRWAHNPEITGSNPVSATIPMKTDSFTVRKIVSILSGQRLNIHDEKVLQAQIKELFTKANFDFSDEYRIDSNNVVDFMVNGDIAIEVKISTKYSKKSIYRQCERYLKFDSVSAMILVTSRSIGFPLEINGKPCYVINLSKAWL